jgi:hypothetical protein
MKDKSLVFVLLLPVVLAIIAACSDSSGVDTAPTATPGVLRNPTASPVRVTTVAPTATQFSTPTVTVVPGATFRPAVSAGVGGPSAGGPATGGGGIGGAAPASGGGSLSAYLVDRKIERNATIDMLAEDVPGTAVKIEAAATAAGGFVSQQTITKTAPLSEDDDSDHYSATVQVRVPADKYAVLVAQLRGFADEITAENATTVEVTAQYTDLEAQLRNLQATEGQYLALLSQAATVNDILTVQDRLTGIQGQIEQVQGQIQLLDNLTALATVTVNISPPLPSPTPSPSPSPTPVPIVTPAPPADPNWAEDAWSDSWGASMDVLRYIGVAAITAGVVAVWLIAALALIAIGWKFFGRSKPAEPAP